MDEPRSIVFMLPDPAGIAARSMTSLAEIHVPRAQPGYLAGWGSVRRIDNIPQDSKGDWMVQSEMPFTRIDTAPPTITGSATTSRRGAMLAVTVTLAVADNLDPSPAVVLASVTSNQPLAAGDVVGTTNADTRMLLLKPAPGRVYSLTYRAVDGSENIGSTVIPVPASR
jgi:hypothetical protein